MIEEIFTKLNWVDIAVLTLFLRILYVSAKNGLVVEFLKLLGIVITIYVSIHYYAGLSDFIGKRFTTLAFSAKFINFSVFISLVVISYLLFTLLRGLICNLIKVETVPMLSKSGGFILGFLRGILTGGLLITILSISTLSYLNVSAKKSYLGNPLFNVMFNTYSNIWNGFMSKLMPNEEFSDVILKDSVVSESQSFEHIKKSQ